MPAESPSTTAPERTLPYAAFRAQTREDVERWGPARAAYILAMRLLRRALGLRIAIVDSRPLYADLEPGPVAEGYVVRELNDEDYARATERPELSISAPFAAAARANGGFCMGAFYRDELVAYVWRAFRDAPANDGFRLRMAPHLRYGYKAYTLPEHRGRHLQSPISLRSDQECLNRGCTLGAAFIETHNFSSIRGNRRRGCEPVGWLVWMRKGPLRLCYSSPGARAFGVALYRPDGERADNED